MTLDALIAEFERLNPDFTWDLGSMREGGYSACAQRRSPRNLSSSEVGYRDVEGVNPVDALTKLLATFEMRP